MYTSCIYVLMYIYSHITVHMYNNEEQGLRLKHKDLTKVHESMRDALKEHLTF